MGWLTKIPFGRGGAAVAEADREDAVSTADTTSGPQLMVLVNDASGRASFKTHVFDDAESATEWVRYWFPMETEDGLTAFWAMTERPEGGHDGAAEPLVMIRDTSRDGVVYLFSFVDIDSAQAFLRDEVERGTQLDTMFLYWAVQVKREIDRWGKLTLTPSTPPGVAAYEPDAETPESDGWVVREAPEVERAPAKPAGDARALMEEAPNARTGVTELDDPGNETFELTSWMERARKKPAGQGDVVRAAAELVAARKNHLKQRREETEPKTVLEEQIAVEKTPESYQPGPFVEAAPVVHAEVESSEPDTDFQAPAVVEEAPLASEPEAVVETAAVVEAAQDAAQPEVAAEVLAVVADTPEPEVAIEPAAVEETDAAAESEVAFEAAAVEESTEKTEFQATGTAAAEANGAEVAEQERRVRASTNGNGHKPPRDAEIVVEINGHKTVHEPLAALSANGSPAVDKQRPLVHEETLPSMNGNAPANGHAAEVTSLNGEGKPAIEHPSVHSDAEAGDAVDQAPNIVHEIRVDAATNGRDETISIQIGIHLQSRALRMKRWEVKDEPFEGFKSPPGRF